MNHLPDETLASEVNTHNKNSLGTPPKVRSKIAKFFSACSVVVGGFIVVVIAIAIFRSAFSSSYDADHEYSDTIVACEKYAAIDIVLDDKPISVTLPTTYVALSDHFTLQVPSIKEPAKNDLNHDGVFDLNPFEGIELSDVYSFFDFSFVNPLYELKPYTTAQCDTLSTHSYSEVIEKHISSFKFGGVELLAPMDDIVKTFGKPSVKSVYDTATYITYDTSYGKIKLTYRNEEENSNPKEITIINGYVPRS